ncbi:hypothetical protein ACFXDP_32300 [Streptomyces sp. NPDC059374]|uniref:hypothetical protein n=1 Tax=Streptomyces sp. NPDC059374 TaxID=3346814 RepID=UPI0036991C03
MTARERTGLGGRLLTGTVWVALLLGLWLWGWEVTDVRPHPSSPPASGTPIPAGPPPDVRLPPAAGAPGAAPGRGGRVPRARG